MSISSKFHAALGKPIYQRCYDLERLIDETNVKECNVIFATLVENVFGFNNQPAWSLLQTSKSRSHHDYTALLHFLGPSGPLFRLIYKLLCDEYLRYEFSLSCLPYPTRMKFEDGNIPNMYRNKVQVAYQQVQNSLWLNAFDFYFFHFTFYMTNHSACKISTSDAPSENLYFSLLESYLEHFLPLRCKEVPLMPHDPAPVRGPILHHSHSHQAAMRSPVARRLNTSQTNELSSPSRYPSLFRQSSSPFPVNAPSPSSSSVTAGLNMGSSHYLGEDLRQTDNWRTESFVQTLAEFWLNQNTMAELQPLNSSPVDHYMPSVDHVRCVRMLLKHLHYFANSLLPSAYQTVVATSLDDLKRTIWGCYVQKKLYVFLKHGFQKWPLDSSYRMMLETWLSYIQPWRYIHPSQTEREDRADDERHSVVNKWTSFVHDNLLFYSELFQDFLVRICRTDLSSSKNSFMMFRVTKIYGATDLADLIERAESKLVDPVVRSAPSRSHSDLSGSYLSPTTSGSYLAPPTFAVSAHHDLATPTVLLSLQSSEPENTSFAYRPLFSARTNYQVEQLLCVIAQAKMNMQGQCANANDTDTGGSLLAWLGLSPLQDYNTTYRRTDDSTDGRKTTVHLDQAAALLKQIFKIDDCRVNELNKSCQSDRSANESFNQSNKLLPPDHVLTNEGPRLTPLGRYQVMNGLRKFPVLYNGDPELRPVASYENATLVKLFYQVATWVNEQLSDHLDEIYKQDTFSSRLLHQLLLPPYRPAATPTKPHSPRQPQTTSQRLLAEKPRVTLRCLGSYRTLTYLAMLYLAGSMWVGMGPVGFLIVLSLGIFLWVAVKAQFCKTEVE